MPITVKRDNPPPYVVTVCPGPDEDSTQTWPFGSLEDAEAAYALAVRSGQFRRLLQTGKGELALTLVSLWQRADGATISGEPTFWYEEIEPRAGEPAGMNEHGASEQADHGT